MAWVGYGIPRGTFYMFFHGIRSMGKMIGTNLTWKCCRLRDLPCMMGSQTTSSWFHIYHFISIYIYISLKSPVILLKGLLLKVAILAKRIWNILKKSQTFNKISNNNWKKNNPRIPKQIPKNKNTIKTRKKRNKFHKRKNSQTSSKIEKNKWKTKSKKKNRAK